MIIDSVQNASKYCNIHPLFAKAFEYIIQQTWLRWKWVSMILQRD